MALPTNTFSTYDAVGAKESDDDAIYNVDPYDRVLLSKMPKTKATQRVHSWQTDALDTPSATNAQLEGDDHSGTAITPTVQLNNVCQIFRKDFTVSDTTRKTDYYGRGDEVAYQKTLKKLALLNDVEMSLFANNAKVTGAEATARELAGIPAWLTSNTSTGATGSDATGDGTDARTDGTQRAFTEALLKPVLASIYDNSGKQPDTMIVGSFNKQAASGFTASRNLDVDAAAEKLPTEIKIYAYDFGAIRIEPSRHIRTRDALVLCSEMWALAELRPLAEKPIATTGDSEKTMMIMEGTLVCRNEKASGGVFDLTTS